MTPAFPPSAFATYPTHSPILEFLGAAPLVLVVVELWAGVSLPAEPRRLLAGLRLVVGEDVGGVEPLGVVVEEAALLVEAVEADDRVDLAALDGLQLADVVDGRAEVVGAVREGAVRPVLDAVAAVVGVVDAHARLVILEVVPPLRVARRPVQERAAAMVKGAENSVRAQIRKVLTHSISLASGEGGRAAVDK